MKRYPIPLVPGPVTCPAPVLAAYGEDYGAADLEPDFLQLHRRTEQNLQRLLRTRERVVIQTGEGMIVLWGALKSCLAPGDRVLSIATGLFGHGIADMAKAVGAEVRVIDLPPDRTLSDLNRVEEEVDAFSPKMITVVHCETPSGTLNPIAELGRLKTRHQVPLLYVDAVSSMGGTEVAVDDWGIDLALGGAQKCLSAPPSMAFLTVSEAAWEAAEAVGYVGYDALKPFRSAQEEFFFPYTPHWHGVAALDRAVERILSEGVDPVFRRHDAVARYCRDRLTGMGLSLFPDPGAVPSPTVTAVLVPEGIPWRTLDQRLRKEGVAVGGNYGPLADKVFRIGHMGTQADMDLVRRGLDVLERVL